MIKPRSRAATIAVAAALLLLLIAGVLVATGVLGGSRARRAGEPGAAGSAPAGNPPPVALPHGASGAAVADAGAASDPDPLPGQGRVTVERASLPGGGFRGRVINWSTGEGVAGAELTFSSAGGEVTTVRSDASGTFDLLPKAPGTFVLATAEAPGFLPYAPEWQHSSVRVTTREGERVKGVTVFLFPAVDYVGLVVDGGDRPVAGAKVRLLGSPAGEQVMAGPATSWVTGRDGTFTFHAPDEALFEAEAGGKRGRARLTGDVAITHKMLIKLGGQAAAAAVIGGRVVTDAGEPLAGVLVRAEPVAAERKLGMAPEEDVRAFGFATSEADGGFLLGGLDEGLYDVTATAEDRAPLVQPAVATGRRDVKLVMPVGVTLHGTVTGGGEPLPAFTLLVFERVGVGRELVLARSIVDGGGRFAVQVEDGEYEVMATASGWAPSPFTPATPAAPADLVLPGGATVRGTVVSAGSNAPLEWARVMREAPGGGASTSPANAGTVTRKDGTFELTGIPPGPLSLTVSAGDHHPKIEAGMVAVDGASIGPVTIALTPLKPGETPTLELVGIGVKLAGDGDALRVDGVVPGGGAERAGVVIGDRITAVDGTAVSVLGMDGAIGRIRGAPGTFVRITLARAPAPVELSIERRAIRS